MCKPVCWFGEQMESRLKEQNAENGIDSWNDLYNRYLFYCLSKKIKELEQAIVEKRKDLKTCVDIANYAMMLADKMVNNLEKQTMMDK